MWTVGLITLIQLLPFALTAPPIAGSATPALILPQGVYNSTAALNISEPIGRLPPSPFDYRVGQSDVIISFDGYGGLVNPFSVIQCLLQAANTVSLHFGSTGPMSTHPLQTNWGNIRLKLYPRDPSIGGGLTWGTWATAIRGITEAVTKYDGYQDLDFYIWKNGVKVGGGLISDR